LNGSPYAVDATQVYERLVRLAMLARGAKSHWLDHRGTRLHALDLAGRGTLPPLALLHGFSASGASQYWAMASQLRQHARQVLLPDLPGHGLSRFTGKLEPEHIQEAVDLCMEKLVEGPAIVFATSMAGAFAVRFAYEHPDRVAGLMLCSPAGAPVSPADRLLLEETFRIDSHQDALAFVDRLFPKPHRLRHLYAWGVRKQFNRPQLQGLLERLGDTPLLRPEELSGLRMPVYLLWGGADRVLPRSHFAFYRAHLPPDTEIDTPALLGHAPFLDRADRVSERLLRFAEKVSGGAR
jgi:pimeloyl-ACP methyl ester carboxylesterase